jgi:hypothetical protein
LYCSNSTYNGGTLLAGAKLTFSVMFRLFSQLQTTTLKILHTVLLPSALQCPAHAQASAFCGNALPIRVTSAYVNGDKSLVAYFIIFRGLIFVHDIFMKFGMYECIMGPSQRCTSYTLLTSPCVYMCIPLTLLGNSSVKRLPRQ